MLLMKSYNDELRFPKYCEVHQVPLTRLSVTLEKGKWKKKSLNLQCHKMIKIKKGKAVKIFNSKLARPAQTVDLSFH